MKLRKKIDKKITNMVLKIPFSNFFYVWYKKCINYIQFLCDIRTFNKKNDGRFIIKKSNLAPYLLDNTETTDFETHYTYHPAWAARIIAKTRPKLHIDFSSFLQFSTIISAFVTVKFYDYRPADIKLDNLETKKGDLLAMPFADNSIESLSCMHTVEHIGLGRYGDLIDPEGDIKAIKELKRVLAKNGTLLFVVPIGKPKLLFNANRVYSYDQIISYFSDLKLQEFTLIPDNAIEIGMIKNTSKEFTDTQENGCGCFWFTKI